MLQNTISFKSVKFLVRNYVFTVSPSTHKLALVLIYFNLMRAFLEASLPILAPLTTRLPWSLRKHNSICSTFAQNWQKPITKQLKTSTTLLYTQTPFLSIYCWYLFLPQFSPDFPTGIKSWRNLSFFDTTPPPSVLLVLNIDQNQNNRPRVEFLHWPHTLSRMI